MKKIIILTLIVLHNFNCKHQLELSNDELKYLIFDKNSNKQINYNNPLLTEEYENWRNSMFANIEEGSINSIQPFFKLNFGKDSIEISLLPLKKRTALEYYPEPYEVEFTIIHNHKITFLPSDYFGEEREEIEIYNLNQVIIKRYNHSDSLNLNCPEWWILGSERNDLIDKRIFKEILNGYIKFTKKRYSKLRRKYSKKEFLVEHKNSFPFRISIEAPLGRDGG